jgi:hypothetical protein
LAGVSGFEAERDNRGREVEECKNDEKNNGDISSSSHLNIKYEDLFTHIVGLGTGEALLFCPSALVDASTTGVSDPEASGVQLGSSTMKVRIRKRITADGGRSIMAN